MKKLGVALFIALLAISAVAQTARQEIEANICLSGSNYLAYPTPQKSLTKAPKGKTPFYISHYARHGSRFLINPDKYIKTLETLQKAYEEGKLTSKGCEVLEKVRMMCAESNNRYGELTALGAEQHRGIARRMYERFPQVFKGNVNIDAKSTVVIRCILSMENELQELISINPKLSITHDASEHDMYYMNYDDTNLGSKRKNDATKAYMDKWTKEHINPQRMMERLFTDQDYVSKNVSAVQLYDNLFELASILQGTELRKKFTLYDIFDKDEIYNLWEQRNIGWFMEYGSNELNGGKMPFQQRNLLRNIITEADSCIMHPRPGATLRFGHETMVMPLTCLLDLNGYGKTMNPSELSENGWKNYKIFPMACNIQFVFYRKDINDKDVLVKVLLNEEEATMPIATTDFPYYRWEDVRAYYLNKINAYIN